MHSKRPGASRSIHIFEAQDATFGITKKRRSVLNANEASLQKAKALEECKTDLLGEGLKNI